MAAGFEDNTIADEGRTGTQMIHRCAKLLTLITTNNRMGMRLVDLYKAADFSRPTAHRILQALVTERLIRQDARTKKYYLGPLVYEMGLAAAPQFDLRDVCRPYLQKVAEATGDTVFLTIRSGFDGVCAARAEGAYPVKAFVLDVGRHRPLNVGGGAIALLSGFENDEIERIYQANKKRIEQDYPRFNVATMWGHISHVRQKGYLINEVLEVQEILSLAMPVFGLHGMPVGALSISALKKRFAGSFLQEKVGILTNAVREIQIELQSEWKEGEVA
jgi:DNA-binding IclR family transcriptional regulator